MTKSNYKDTFNLKDISIRDEMAYIPWEIISEKMGSEYKQFMEWMNGQSSFTDGAYVCDIRNYYYKRDRGELNGLPRGY